jgi:hypothetical protein
MIGPGKLLSRMGEIEKSVCSDHLIGSLLGSNPVKTQTESPKNHGWEL